MSGQTPLTGVHLFAGAGGMALGLRRAGFGPARVYERDIYAQKTLAANALDEVVDPARELHRGDVQLVDWDEVPAGIDLLAGGVPCQPFSFAGKHLAERDGRNMFPEFFRAAATLRPKAMFVENVSGLARASFRPYLDYVIRRMTDPSVGPLHEEIWQDHDARLCRHQASEGYQPEYTVVWSCLDAADYGVPQNRKRIFIVATRADLPEYVFPPPTHSRSALLRSLATGAYWERHGIKPRPVSLGKGRERAEDGTAPWVTVRDALATLPPACPRDCGNRLQHWQIPGARSYYGHSGSQIDWPSKSLKAGVNGVPGGENTVVDEGMIRYFTLREAARIQTFPDTHWFHGSRKQITKQIGNAVPCLLAEVLARQLHTLLYPTEQPPADHDNA